MGSVGVVAGCSIKGYVSGVLAAEADASMGMALQGGLPFWGAVAEFSLGSINSGSLVHVCTFPPPIKRKGSCSAPEMSQCA